MLNRKPVLKEVPPQIGGEEVGGHSRGRLRYMIVWVKETPPPVFERGFGYRYCEKAGRRILEEGFFTVSPGDTIRSLRGRSGSDRPDPVLVVSDPEIYLYAPSLEEMKKALCDSGASAVGPVFNETEMDRQKAQLAVPYLDAATFAEAAEGIAESLSGSTFPADNLDQGCFLLSRECWEHLDDDLLFGDLHKEVPGGAVIARGALVHRFTGYFSAERGDLVALVPPQVKRVLDVGSAEGMYGRELKKVRPEVFIAAVEPNKILAGKASAFYDQVISAPFEETAFEEKFDLVNMGDVLEHLFDPWKALREVSRLLDTGGCLTGSVPNSGHWTIVRNLLQGSFDYLPVGLLCVGHLRFFTEETLRGALAEAGFAVEEFVRESIEPSREGALFIRAMAESGHGDETSLKTNEFLFRCRKKHTPLAQSGGFSKRQRESSLPLPSTRRR